MNRRLRLAALLTLLPSAVALAAADPAPASAENTAPPPAAQTPPPAADTPATTSEAAAAPAEAAAPADVHSDLAAERDRLASNLATALRSYTLMRDEHDQLATALEKSTAENTALQQQLADVRAQVESLRAQLQKTSAVAAEAGQMREQARQMQDEAAALAVENHNLKTRLAILAPPPASSLAAPLRPNTASASAALQPAPAAAPAPTAAAPATPAAPQVHTVVLGDTLGKIARQYYGDANRWPEILAANRNVIANENVLVVGTTLRIP